MSDLISIAENISNEENKVKEAVSMAKRMLSDSIWKSANVEGLGTTFPNTEAILENLPVMTKRDEVLFILNMRDAWHFLLDNLTYNNCWMLVREFNKIVGRGLIYRCGELRVSDVSIGGTSWKPEMPYIDDVLENMIRISSMSNPEELALEYFLYLTRAQLFPDGNKRVAQLMANKVLIENGVGILAIPVEYGVEFKTLLIKYYETGDGSDLKQFLRDKCITRV